MSMEWHVVGSKKTAATATATAIAATATATAKSPRFDRRWLGTDESEEEELYVGNPGISGLPTSIQQQRPSQQKNDITRYLPSVEGMEIHDNGGPFSSRLLPAAISQAAQTTPRDRAVMRTPESRALHLTKNAIQKEERWDDFKKITNPYEYVFLSWNRRSSRSVGTRQPLSRSYFKMVEIWKRANLATEIAPLIKKNGGALRTAHAAEGPGGFIEACWERGGALGWTVERTTAITLRSDARNIPGWRKAARFLADRPQICIHDGIDGTGNILNAENQEAFIGTAAGSHIYTADGGFDFSSDYNAQEDTIFPLLLAEFIIGIEVLEVGGCLIIKCFDTTERQTLDLLWIACHCFREWSILKPKTSRAGNAERYFVGKGRLPHIADAIAFMKAFQTRKNWNQPMLEIPESEKVAWSAWRDKLVRFQEEIEHVEYETIRKTLDLIHAHDFPRIRSLVRENIYRSIQWCKEFDEPISAVWSTEIDRNITRETQDLLHILSPTHTHHTFYNNSWYNGSRTSTLATTTAAVSAAAAATNPQQSALSFRGFRSDRVEPIYTTVGGAGTAGNPFMRKGHTAIPTM